MSFKKMAFTHGVKLSPLRLKTNKQTNKQTKKQITKSFSHSIQDFLCQNRTWLFLKCFHILPSLSIWITTTMWFIVFLLLPVSFKKQWREYTLLKRFITSRGGNWLWNCLAAWRQEFLDEFPVMDPKATMRTILQKKLLPLKSWTAADSGSYLLNCWRDCCLPKHTLPWIIIHKGREWIAHILPCIFMCSKLKLNLRIVD